jgi:dihydrofolate reductase
MALGARGRVTQTDAMSKIVVFNMVSVNGYFERGPWGLDWHRVDSEFNDFAIRQLDSLDTLLFGRATYAREASVPKA